MYSAASTSLATRPPGPLVGAPVSAGPPMPLVTWQLGEGREGSKVTSRSTGGSDPWGEEMSVVIEWRGCDYNFKFHVLINWFLQGLSLLGCSLQRDQNEGSATEQCPLTLVDVSIHQQGGCLMTEGLNLGPGLRLKRSPLLWSHWSLIVI